MNKLFKNLIIILVIVCTISTVSFAKNMTNENGAGTVTWDRNKVLNNIMPGTKDNPYQLVMGEGLIDIYYGDNVADVRQIYFEFTSGNYNAGNYIVEHNADKKRIRFTLLGTGQEDLRVTSETGLNYLQAGGITFVPYYLESADGKIESEETNIEAVVQEPFYKIEATESYNTTRTRYYDETVRYRDYITTEKRSTTDSAILNRSYNLGNGYINTSIISNISAYGTSYVFSKSNISYNIAYQLSDKQQSDWKNIRLNYTDTGYLNIRSGDVTYLIGSGQMIYGSGRNTTTKETVDVYVATSPVKVVYCFDGTSSAIINEKKAGWIESIISKIFISIGDAFVTISGLGGTKATEAVITLDSLIFNEYPNTIVNFFGDTGYTNAKAQKVIEFWFDIFKAWAIIVYIVLLIYIGIKTVLMSGTSEQKKIKGMLEGWLIGILLLFFMPFLFKYLIVINDTLVDVIRVNSKYSVHAYYTFEHMYDVLGGQEDGENSTTTILARLKDAKKYTKEEIKNLEQEKNRHKENLEEMQNAYNDMLENGKDSDLGKLIFNNIELNKNSLNKNLSENGWKIYKNGEEITVDVIQKDLSEIFTTFYSNQENRDKLLAIGGLEAVLNELGAMKNKDFKNEIDKYCDSIKIALTADGTNVLKRTNQLYNSIYALGYWITGRDCYDLFIEARAENINAATNEIQETEEKINNIEIAINKLENNDVDITGDMRVKADTTGRFFYVAVWFILVFEVILLLILYYKRLFMLMVLIAIFPLVTVAYAYERAKGEKAKILKNWIQEYVVNVFIQSMHAILYVTLVEAGYTVYLGNSDSWLIFIMAVIALITVEPIFKHILGLKSSTVTDLAKYGASSLKVVGSAVAVGSVVTNTGKDLKNIDNQGKNKDASIKKKQERNDKRAKTRRQHRDNQIKKDKNLTKEQKEKKLKAKEDKDGKRDNRKDWLRKKAMSARKHARRIRKINRVVKNSTGLMGAVAGGLAAGGGLDDFATAAGVAKILTGTGGKNVDLTDDAKKLDKAKVSSETKTGNVSSENDNSKPNYSGASYDNYGYGSQGGQNVSPIEEQSGGGFHPIKAVRNWHDSKVANTFAQRLDEEKIYVNKKYNVSEEDE